MSERHGKSDWSRRYARRHRYVPILDDPLLPNGRRGRVRIYRRGLHNGPGPHRFILNWFERGGNRKRAVVGDKFTAVAEADRINGRLTAYGRSGYAYRRQSVAQLIERYVRHQDQRADAGEISPKSAARYRSALRHLCDFAARFAGTVRFGACGIDETFVLTLKAHLRTLQVRPNGHPNALPRPMTAAGSRFVLASARAAWQWGQGQDPALLPPNATNPFRGHIAAPRPRDLIDCGSLDPDKICAIVGQCDAFQLITFAPLIFYGLRAAEPCCLFVEDWRRGEGLLRVGSAPELDYQTKGRVDKLLPVPALIRQILAVAVGSRIGGPLLQSRTHFCGDKRPADELSTKETIIAAYRRKVQGSHAAKDRCRALREVLRAAGAVSPHISSVLA